MDPAAFENRSDTRLFLLLGSCNLGYDNPFVYTTFCLILILLVTCSHQLNSYTMKTNQKVILHQYGLILLMLFVLGVIMTSCSKDEASSQEELPELTSEGKNTFGCLVNGEKWVAYRSYKVGGGVSLDGYYDSQTKYFQLVASRRVEDENRFESIKLLLDSLTSEGVYNMRVNHLSTKGLTDYLGNYNCSRYYYDTTLVHQVSIETFLPEQGIISGTFEMDLVNPSCPGDTVKIREGRFDWCY